ncbi:unnamed protein product [Brugia timori]|uniref:ATPase_AAA_core domain-containing protein n=1 Tax=Brugia timori TaxID=42155 RepID=A0A0R3R4Y4_9BILA|nr:unnamed protein product [Brugia timori]
MISLNKHNKPIEVENWDYKEPVPRYNTFFPNVIRAGIFGPSGCGKTNVLIQILLEINTYHHIYLCSKTSNQEKYVRLKQIINIYNDNQPKHTISFTTLPPNNLPEPEKIQPNSVIIFDDILTDPQANIATYFLRGRHHNISCFYLAQTYSKVPKQCIRDNFNYIIIFKQDDTNLKHIHNNHVTDLNFETFKKMCNLCWEKKYGFLIIDKECDDKNKVYNLNFESSFQLTAI